MTDQARVIVEHLPESFGGYLTTVHFRGRKYTNINPLITVSFAKIIEEIFNDRP